MTNKEILDKAFEKAKANGYEQPNFFKWAIDSIFDSETWAHIGIVNWVILSPEFAKAFWSEDIIAIEGLDENLKLKKESVDTWQYHLQQMVLEKDRVKYLKQFL